MHSRACNLRAPTYCPWQGATCYLNSLVQSLYCLPEFRTAVLSLGASGAVLPKLTASLKELFGNLSHAPVAVSTEAFTLAVQWGSVSRQQVCVINRFSVAR